MLRLSLNPEPRWIDLVGGARALVAPVTTAMMDEVAKDIASKVDLSEVEAAKEAGASEDELVETVTRSASFLDWSRAIARRAILDFDGVFDEGGAPVPAEPDWIDAVLDTPACHTRFLTQVTYPALGVVAEGNGSAAGPNGTSAPTATAADATGSATPAR